MKLKTHSKETIERLNKAFNSDITKVLYPNTIFNTLDEIFNTDFWNTVKRRYYAPEIKSIEDTYRKFTFFKGYQIEDNIYIHFKYMDELMFNKLEVHGSIDNGGFNNIAILPNDALLFSKVNGENSEHNRDIWKTRNITITKESFI